MGANANGTWYWDKFSGGNITGVGTTKSSGVSCHQELSEIISNQCAAPSIYRMGIVLGQLSTRFRTFQKLPRLINMRHVVINKCPTTKLHTAHSTGYRDWVALTEQVFPRKITPILGNTDFACLILGWFRNAGHRFRLYGFNNSGVAARRSSRVP